MVPMSVVLFFLGSQVPRLDGIKHCWCAKCHRGKGKWTKDHNVAKHQTAFMCNHREGGSSGMMAPLILELLLATLSLFPRISSNILELRRKILRSEAVYGRRYTTRFIQSSLDNTAGTSVLALSNHRWTPQTLQRVNDSVKRRAHNPMKEKTQTIICKYNSFYIQSKTR